MSNVLDYINGTGKFKGTSTRCDKIDVQAVTSIKVPEEKGSRHIQYNRRRRPDPLNDLRNQLVREKNSYNKLY